MQLTERGDLVKGDRALTVELEDGEEAAEEKPAEPEAAADEDAEAKIPADDEDKAS